MEFTSVVLYNERLTYYDVYSTDGWHFKARLLKYKDTSKPPPPKEIELHREGMRWYGNADEELIAFLGFDIENKLRVRNKQL